MNENIQVSKETIANDFEESVKGVLDKELIEAAKAGITSKTTASYPAQGSLASLLFYVKLGVETNDNRFEGNAGGISSIGGGGFRGKLYTDDTSRLYKETTAFYFYSNPVYFNICFFNNKGMLLGYIHAGALSLVSGSGGGPGNWVK